MADKMLAGTKVLMVIAPNEFRDEELLEPQSILTEAGAQVTVASTTGGEATGMLGARVKPDTTIDKVKASDFKAIIVVGGMGSPEHLWENKTLHGLLSECSSANNVVAAICLSGAVLGKSGVLRNKQATVWATPESLKALEEGGAKYVQKPVCHDGNVITADGPDAAREFGQTIAQALARSTAKV